MIRNVFLFLATFAAGAAIALLIRTARFDAHAGHATETPGSGAEHAPMVSNALVPAKAAEPSPPAAAPKSPSPASATHDAHAGHGAAAAMTAKPVNTVCAICGMDVDPNVPTAQYQGKTIGFGCKLCPPKFRAEPDRYGPFYLRNEVVKK